MPDRTQVRAATTRARKAWRFVRRIGRWGFAAIFVGGSLFTLWSQAGRIPILRNLDLPSIEQVFGGGDEEETEQGASTTTATSSEGSDPTPSNEPRSVVDLVESIEATQGVATVQGAFDGDRETGWIPCDGCESPFGVGESMTIRFTQPVTISEITIVNGLAGVDSALPVMTVEVIFENGSTIPLGFQETIQRWRFSDERLQMATSSLTFRIEGVFRVDETVGTTSLAEIELIGVTGADE